METIYNLRIFIIIAIWFFCGYLIGCKPDKIKGWGQSAVMMIGAMLIYMIIHWPPPV